ncbi:energy-coupling factor ABC transporter ATP-binding protein [Desulfosarcina sp. OttesenSCG-928-G10]|nr:energy-coupling factor ABC transporter ATP-binding protein [Desulfosarcina sp. OttesenSCG-928-G10]MDL2321948.1 energy-coupling factor ABC transporter ATP-binding protein [Desulfosarcina sp. OttesenSCG-928-B08]
MAPVILQLSDICYQYPGGPMVLDHLDFHLHAGDRIGLVAPNGSGKTTLFHMIMGLLKPISGTLEAFGQTLTTEADFVQVRRRIGLLFQDADDQLFSPTVLEDVAFGPLNLGKSKSEAIAISIKTLAFLGLEGFSDRVTHKLSGGEKRLVALATVLAMEPEVLLLDEPSSGLDIRTRETLIQVLDRLDLSLVIISHDFDFLSRTATRFYTMANGRIVPDRELHVHTHTHAHPMGQQPHGHE